MNVEDIELATVPLTRFQVRNGQSQGGITVRLAAGDPDTVEIRFFDVDGRDIDPAMQRKVERLLSREDFRRAFGGEIGDIEYPPRSLEFYTAALERVVDIDADAASARFKIVLDYCFGAVSIVMPNLLTKLGAEVLAVNPFASTASATAGVPARPRERIAELVRASGSDLGFVVDPDGELATVVDDTGHVLEREELLLAIAALVGRGGARGAASRCRSTSPARWSGSCRRRRWCARRCGAPTSWRPRAATAWCSPAPRTAGASGPTSSPPSTPPPRW